MTEQRRDGRAAVASKSGDTVAGYRFDRAVRVDFPDAVVAGVGYVDVPDLSTAMPSVWLRMA